MRYPALYFCLLFAGCGSSLSHTIDNSKLRDMSRRGQLWVYDAENEIVVALDRLDEARDLLRDVRRQMRIAEKRIEAAEKRGNSLGVNAAEGRLVALEALESWAKANVRLQRLGVVVSRGAVELAKAQVIQREDLLGGKDFTVKDFKEQYQRLKQRFDRRKKTVKALRDEARQKEARWWALRRRFVAQTGDHNSGLWLD